MKGHGRMTKISHQVRAEINGMFKDDILAIQAAMREKLEKFWEAVKGTIIDEVGIHGKLDDVARAERDIAEMKLELQRVRERMQNQIASMERALIDLRSSAVGEYSGPPTTDQLRELNLLDHDASIERRQWYGFPIRTKLDAATAIRMMASADISMPIRALEGVVEATKRDLTFAGTVEQAKEVYRKFHHIGFREMGVDLPPMLEDVVGIGGGKNILAASIIEEKRQLSSGKKGG